MSREEAIKELQESHDMMRSYDVDETESRLMQALNMAISALEQEPIKYWIDYNGHVTPIQQPCKYWQNGTCNGNTEVCEDAISRDAVINAFADYYRCKPNDLDAFKEFKVIKELPSVTPSRHKGHWIKEVDFGNCVHYVCSECKNEGEKDYCPNCGAEME